jgi:hypothetical protein
MPLRELIRRTSYLRRAILGAVLVCPLNLVAQQDSLLVVGARTRVTDGNRQTIGRLVRLGSERLELESSDGLTTNHLLNDLVRVEVSTGRISLRRTGAIVGFAVGAVAGIIGQATVDDSEQFFPLGGGEILLAGGLFGALGAGAGYLVGGVLHRDTWHEIPREGWAQASAGGPIAPVALLTVRF